MKPFYLLSALLPLALAAVATPPCECPLVKCPGEQPALCKCLNSAAIECAKRCGGNPTTKKCSTPTPTSTRKPTAKVTSKTSKATPTPSFIPCATQLGLQCPPGQNCIDDPRNPSCLIAADCSGICVEPLPKPIPCGTLRGLQCPPGQRCVNDPRTPGCLIAADCPGVCVSPKAPFCSGFGNLPCPDPRQVCVDNPFDSCGPPSGRDCGGLCV